MTSLRWLGSEVTLNSKPSWFIYGLFANFEANKHITTMITTTLIALSIIFQSFVSTPDSNRISPQSSPDSNTISTQPTQELSATQGGSGGWDERD